MTERLVFRVDEEEEGERLDLIIAARVPELSRSHVQKAFAGGEVLVDGRARPKSFRPAQGAEVAFEPPETPSGRLVPQDLPLEVLHEDDHLLVVNKPVGMVVHPGPGHPDGTLVNALLHHDPRLADAGDPARPGIVHRLDRETSGLLVVARTAAAHAALAEQLRDRSLGRVYLALAWGRWPEAAGLLEGDIGRHPRDRQRMAVVSRGGREAATRYEVLDELEFVQLCRVELLTGRTHQIRVHFAHFGHPVVGDPVYGDDRRARNVLPVDRGAAAALVKAVSRQMLHAQALHLRHPATGERLDFEAPLAPDFAAALAGLRRRLGRPADGTTEPA